MSGGLPLAGVPTELEGAGELGTGAGAVGRGCGAVGLEGSSGGAAGCLGGRRELPRRVTLDRRPVPGWVESIARAADVDTCYSPHAK
jgi:hypothetical protein